MLRQDFAVAFVQTARAVQIGDVVDGLDADVVDIHEDAVDFIVVPAEQDLLNLRRNGVRTAAWATLRWVKMLAHPFAPKDLDTMILDLEPGRLRRAWLNWWLRNNLSSRLAVIHWIRLLGFSLCLHDNVADVARAVAGRQRARRNRKVELAEFERDCRLELLE